MALLLWLIAAVLVIGGILALVRGLAELETLFRQAGVKPGDEAERKDRPWVSAPRAATSTTGASR